MMDDNTRAPLQFEVVVVGGGPSGLSAALGLAQAGLSTALVARRAPYADNRTTALLGPSVDWLQAIGVWDDCSAQAAAMRTMRLVDDTGRLFRAPEIAFQAHEIEKDAFGYNIENRVLVAALEARAAQSEAITRFDTDAVDVLPGDDDVAVTLASGEAIRAPLVVGADGRNSICRDAAGLSVSHRDYPQTALTFNVAHSRPHNDTSTEFHTREGPCVIVPLPGQRSSVVWVMSPSRAQETMALSDAELSSAIERQSHSVLGAMQVEPGRFLFPLSAETIGKLADRRIALIGEAAHVVPPIGAQGLNLGLRDAQAIVELAAEARPGGMDCGSPQLLSRYARARRMDIDTRTRMIDAANRTLLSDLLPVQALRACGMGALASLPPLRRAAMRGGFGDAIFAARPRARA